MSLFAEVHKFSINRKMAVTLGWFQRHHKLGAGDDLDRWECDVFPGLGMEEHLEQLVSATGPEKD